VSEAGIGWHSPRVVWLGEDRDAEAVYDRLKGGRPRLVTIVSDGGPWALHDMPCPVCVEQKAVLDLNTGRFGPCGECQREGWRLTRARKPWWRRR
jgi:hypothetical protein